MKAEASDVSGACSSVWLLLAELKFFSTREMERLAKTGGWSQLLVPRKSNRDNERHWTRGRFDDRACRQCVPRHHLDASRVDCVRTSIREDTVQTCQMQALRQ